MTDYERAMLVATAGTFQMVAILAQIEVARAEGRQINSNYTEEISKTVVSVADSMKRNIERKGANDGS